MLKDQLHHLLGEETSAAHGKHREKAMNIMRDQTKKKPLIQSSKGLTNRSFPPLPAAKSLWMFVECVQYISVQDTLTPYLFWCWVQNQCVVC